MPRGRGGPRQGTPGTAYGNRTDLNMPISTVPGQAYGEAGKQADAQRAVPMAQSSTPAPQQQAPQRPTVTPGSIPFTGPTERPNEPITAGISLGPGPGPEAITPRPQNILADSLRFLVNQPEANDATYELAAQARMLGL